uniref:Uncharacterized protein n=1 Tax=Cacopsylla melanoneura TaxID=428564 RepID=A0A8D8XG74_9HEMI
MLFILLHSLYSSIINIFVLLSTFFFKENIFIYIFLFKRNNTRRLRRFNNIVDLYVLFFLYLFFRLTLIISRNKNNIFLLPTNCLDYTRIAVYLTWLTVHCSMYCSILDMSDCSL